MTLSSYTVHALRTLFPTCGVLSLHRTEVEGRKFFTPYDEHGQVIYPSIDTLLLTRHPNLFNGNLRLAREHWTHLSTYRDNPSQFRQVLMDVLYNPTYRSVLDELQLELTWKKARKDANELILTVPRPPSLPDYAAKLLWNLYGFDDSRVLVIQTRKNQQVPSHYRPLHFTVYRKRGDDPSSVQEEDRIVLNPGDLTKVLRATGHTPQLLRESAGQTHFYLPNGTHFPATRENMIYHQERILREYGTAYPDTHLGHLLDHLSQRLSRRSGSKRNDTQLITYRLCPH